jgi:hypothetical protein
MRMSDKFIKLVLAFVCCTVAVSGASGSGSGNGGGGNSSSGGGSSNSGGGSNSGRNGQPATTTTTSSSGGSSNSGGQGNNQNENQGGGNQGGGGNRKLASLKTVAVPGPTAAELNDLVRNKAAAIALGKAFFWEMQFGSDGFTACATCHFNAGADSRTMNQADPGLRRVDASGNPSADSTIFHPGFGPNHQLSVSDFPLHRLADITRSNSLVLSDNNNIVGSQGVYLNNFNDVVLGLGPKT